MRDEAISIEWLSRWRSEVEAVLRALTSNFEEKHGYPQGTNAIRLPNADDRAAASELAREYPMPGDLVTFYQHIAEVTLADVGNAHFIHSPGLVLNHLRSYQPVRLSVADGVQLLMIASDGGGIWFAVDAGGSVYRSDSASTETGDFTKLAGNFREYLELIHCSIVRLIETD